MNQDALDYSAFYFKVPRGIYRALKREQVGLRVCLEIIDRVRYTSDGPMTTRRGTVVDVGVGQCVIGRNELAIDLGLTADQVRGAIDRLRKLGVISTREVKARGTVVTLNGYAATFSAATVAPSSPANPPTSAPAETEPRCEVPSSSPQLRPASSPHNPHTFPTNEKGDQDLPKISFGSGSEQAPAAEPSGDRDREGEGLTFEEWKARRAPRAAPTTRTADSCKPGDGAEHIALLDHLIASGDHP